PPRLRRAGEHLDQPPYQRRQGQHGNNELEYRGQLVHQCGILVKYAVARKPITVSITEIAVQASFSSREERASHTLTWCAISVPTRMLSSLSARIVSCTSSTLSIRSLRCSRASFRTTWTLSTEEVRAYARSLTEVSRRLKARICSSATARRVSTEPRL